METNRLPHPSSPYPKLQGELPLLGGMMPVSQGTIQRQPLFRGLSQELKAEMGTLALPETGAVVQRKLTLGTPDDMYEQEADRVARQVVDEIHSSPFREQNAQSEEERIPAGGEAGRVQRQITVRASGDTGGEVSSEWEGELQRAKSGGQPLSLSVKEPMEQAFGADFGGVRVHTGTQADRLARSIQAKAFTTGQDMFFRQGAYEPGSRGGHELLAHELTHVVQQSGAAREARQQVDGINLPQITHTKEERSNKEKKRVQRIKMIRQTHKPKDGNFGGEHKPWLETGKNMGYVIPKFLLYSHSNDRKKRIDSTKERLDDAIKLRSKYKDEKKVVIRAYPDIIKKKIWGGDLYIKTEKETENTEKETENTEKETENNDNPKKDLEQRVEYINGMRYYLEQLIKARQDTLFHVKNNPTKEVYAELIRNENKIINKMTSTYVKYYKYLLQKKHGVQVAERMILGYGYIRGELPGVTLMQFSPIDETEEI
ncbi:eCIS core domain-containing protein [Microcoleus vaginatus]|uniref:eCIS core domain-containing protein n=1 Tax=Microcoleus vaginatus TaxID=119532 RepID=UPI0032A56640